MSEKTPDFFIEKTLSKETKDKKRKRRLSVALAALLLTAEHKQGLLGITNDYAKEEKKRKEVARLEKEKTMSQEEKELSVIYQKGLKAYEAYEKMKKKAFLLKNNENNQDYVVLAEEIKKEVTANVASEEYLKKLEKEFSGDCLLAKKTQKDRLTFLKNVKTIFVKQSALFVQEIFPLFEAIEDDPNNYPFVPLPDWFLKKLVSLKGFYKIKSHRVILPDDFDKDTYFHEYFHASVQGQVLSEKAKEILKESFERLGKNEKTDQYQEKVEERFARKKQLDFELENLGIKKYKEKFNRRHFEKMMDGYSRGWFSRSVNEFIEMTKPEYFEKIFNEIAQKDLNDPELIKNV